MSAILHHRRNAFRAFDGFGASSRDFDGANDYVLFGGAVTDYDYIQEAKTFTLAAWVKVADQGESEAIETILSNSAATYDCGFIFMYDNRAYIGTTDALRLIIWHGSGVGSEKDDLIIDEAITDTGWHHVAVTGDGVTLKAYIDGTVSGTTETVTYTGNYSNPTYNIAIGRYQFSTPAGYFDGNIADVRIYDVDIGASAISGLSNGIDYQADLDGWWKLNEAGVNPTLADSAGSNDGTNNGTSESTDGPAD